MEEEDDRRWFLGIDWGSQTHVARLADHRGHQLGARGFAHSGEGLAQMADWALALSKAPEPRMIHVAIEVPHGPVVEALMERGFSLYAINPKQSDRFRDRFSPAGSKDDSRDAEVLSDAIRTDPQAFRTLTPDLPQVVELREWTRMHDELGQERIRLVNQLRDQLWRYYPQALQVAGGGLGDDWVLDLWALAPTPQAARRVRKDTVGRLLKRHRIRRITADQVIDTLRARPLQVPDATAKAASAHIGLLAKRLTLVNRQIREIDGRIDRLLATFDEDVQAPGQPQGQRDATIMRTLPGIGRMVAATLLAEAWEPLQRRDYHAIRCLCGTAPVTRQSGKTVIVQRRRAANPRLAGALYHWARVAVQHDPVCRAKYSALRARGKGHARALRAIGDRNLAVLCAMLQQQTAFDPDCHRHTQRAA